MSISETRIRYLLCQDSDESLAEAEKILLMNNHTDASPELLVLLAERSVSRKKYEAASGALRAYFSSERSKNQNQFYCRALFATASIEVHRSTELRNQEKIDGLKYACSFAHRAVEIALKSGYEFLVYNGSVLVFNILSCALRDGGRSLVVEELQKVVSALQTIQHENVVWRVQLLMTVAECYSEIGNAEKIAKNLSSALDIMSDDMDEHIKSRMMDVCVDAATKFSSNSSCRALRTRVESLQKNAKNSFRSALQSVRSAGKSMSVQDCEKELMKVLRDTLSSDQMAWFEESIDTKTSTSSTSLEGTECVLDVGLNAIDRDLVHLATTCLKVAEMSSSRGPRHSIMLDLLRARLGVKNDGLEIDTKTMKRKDVEQAKIKKRVSALKLVERSLVSANRIHNEWLIHQSVFAAWEIGMYLLTSRHRRYVHRMFGICADALQQIDSPQLELRSRLHFEVAKCELEADFLAKAVIHVDRALDLDYGDLSQDVKKDEEDETKQYVNQNRVRGLDKHLIPMKRELEIRSSVYKQPESGLEKALLVLAQIRGANDKHLKLSLLDRATQYMMSPSQDRKITEKRAVAKTWSNIADMAFRMGKLDTANLAADHVLQDETWDPEIFPDISKLQALARFLKGRIVVRRFRKRKSASALGLIISSNDGEESHEKNEENEMKRDVLRHFRAGMEIGLKLDAKWIVESAVVYVWNYHIHIVSNNTYEGFMPELQDMMLACLEAMSKIESSDVTLYCSLCRALGTYSLRVKKYSDAIKVCEQGIAFATNQQGNRTRHLVDILARAHLANGTKPSSIVSSVVQGWEASIVACVAVLDSANNDNNLMKLEARRALLERCVETSEVAFEKDRGNVDDLCLDEIQSRDAFHTYLWAQLAEQAVHLELYRLAQKCTKHTISILPDSQRDRDLMSSETLCSLVVAETIWGEAMFSMAKDATVQEALFEDASTHFVIASDWASKAGDAELVITLVQRFWTCFKPMTHTTKTKAMMFDPCRRLLNVTNTVVRNKNKNVSKLRLCLYHLILDILKERKEWKRGLDTCVEACKYVSSTMQRTIWEVRVLFMSKLGLNVKGGVAKMKENSSSARAKIWVTLARSATRIEDQLESYQAALESLETGSLDRVPYLVEIAKWMFENEFRDEAIEHLLAASDIFRNIERLNESHCTTLASIFVTLAEMSSTFSQRAEFCLLAVHYYSKLWNTTLSQARRDRVWNDEMSEEERAQHESFESWISSLNEEEEDDDEVSKTDLTCWIGYKIPADSKDFIAKRLRQEIKSQDLETMRQSATCLNSMLRDQGYAIHAIVPLRVTYCVQTMLNDEDEHMKIVAMQLCVCYDDLNLDDARKWRDQVGQIDASKIRRGDVLAESTLQLGEIETTLSLLKNKHDGKRVRAVCAYLSGDAKSAARLFKDSAREICRDGNPRELTRFVRSASSVGLISSELLRTCCDSLQSLSPERGECPDVLSALATCKTELATTYASEALLKRQQRDDTWETSWKQARSHFDEAAALYGSSHPNQIRVLIRRCEAMSKILTSDSSKEEQLSYLNVAESTAKQCLARSAPFSLPENVSHPISRLLSSVKKRIGDLELEVARREVERNSNNDVVQMWIERNKEENVGLDSSRRSFLQHAAAETLLRSAPKQMQIEASLNVARSGRTLTQTLGGLSSVWKESSKEEEEEEEEEDVDFKTKLLSKEKENKEIQYFLSRTIETLQHTVQDALQNQLLDTAGLAALELVECSGKQCPNVCALNIALFQSCVTSSNLRKMFASISRSDGQTRVFENLKHHLERSLLDSTRFPASKLTNSVLRSRHTYRRLSVSRPEEWRRSIPKGTIVLVLQHSPSGEDVYAAMIPWGNMKCVVRKHRWTPMDRRQLEAMSVSNNQKMLKMFDLRLKRDLMRSSDDDYADGHAVSSMMTTNALLLQVIPWKQFPEGTQNVLICADMKLSALPLESLGRLKDFKVHRDFSLAMFDTRSRDENSNIVSSMSYVSDPFHEEDEEKTVTIPQSWKSLSTKPNQIASEIEVRRGLCSSNGFLFHSLGRVYDFLNISELADTDLRSCKAVILVDGAENETSLRRGERSKSKYMTSYEIAALFSVLGANTVLLNQWPARVSENKDFLKRVCNAKTASKLLQSGVGFSPNCRIRNNVSLYGLASMKFN